MVKRCLRKRIFLTPPWFCLTNWQLVRPDEVVIDQVCNLRDRSKQPIRARINYKTNLVSVINLSCCVAPTAGSCGHGSR